MELTLYILLFIFSFVIFWLSTRQSDMDLSNTYQVQYTFLSLITWSATALSSFNIEYIYLTDTIYKKSYIEYAFVGISLSFIVMTMLNVIVIGIYGSWNMLFKMTKNNKRPDDNTPSEFH